MVSVAASEFMCDPVELDVTAGMAGTLTVE